MRILRFSWRWISGLPNGLWHKLERRLFMLKSRKAQFNAIAQRGFGESVSLSGSGSDLAQTERLRNELPNLFRRHGIRSILDIPCGDFFWMRHVDLTGVSYIGADIVETLVAKNNELHRTANRYFGVKDLCSDELPRADLVLCRDCLVHLKLGDGMAALRNIKSSGAKFLLATTFPGTKVNVELPLNFWRPLNLEQPPFCMEKPVEILLEGCTESGGEFSDKSLALWRI